MIIQTTPSMDTNFLPPGLVLCSPPLPPRHVCTIVPLISVAWAWFFLAQPLRMVKNPAGEID